MTSGHWTTLLLVTFSGVQPCGARCLCSHVRQSGRTAHILNLRLSDRKRGVLSRSPAGQMHRSMLNPVLSFIERYDHVGISLYTDTFHQSVFLTNHIRKRLPGKTITWGGIHPTPRPIECLEHADYVCVGEGYYSLVDLLCKHDVRGGTLHVGVQSGSARMLRTYKRRQSNEDILKVSSLFSKHSSRIVPMSYDIILDGYEETVEDTSETARLISQIQRPFFFESVFSKTLPGNRNKRKDV